MNPCNALTLPLTTVKQFAQRASDYTCTCPDDFSNEWACPIVMSTIPSGLFGGLIGCVRGGEMGLLAGAYAGAGVGATLTTCFLIACYGSECVKLRQRQITTCTKQDSLANGQQQSLKLPSAPPLLGAESLDANSNCTTPVQSQPELMNPFLLSGNGIQSDPPVFLQSDIAGKKSTTGIACPAFCPGSQTNYV
ncbi:MULTISPECIES: hypothetical protein [Gammaproteobacteria]|uniref:hypothetical protein n=1 Tax=Gammaproteobacteria TaxID=1236 RepID=UPI001ADADC4E|nr:MULTISPECIES: hypothetical protein [Gammaproteobacteria]MBO9480872.1 hypothetical protein [Salinisphaera sp. G21_0]MBO9495202.1 hypothetical protein [Thalassotalea sp. G20_0]